MSQETLAECERIVNGLLSYSQNDRALFSKYYANLTYNTIQYVLDGAESLDDLEACEKTVYGTKIEKRVIRFFGFPAKISRRKNPHNLILDTRIDGIDLDWKATLGGKNWMIPTEAHGHWLFLQQVVVKAECFHYGLVKALPEYLNKGKNKDSKVTLNEAGREAIYWIDRDVSYARPAL